MSTKKTKKFEKGCQAKKNFGKIFFWFLWLRRSALRCLMGLNACGVSMPSAFLWAKARF